MRGLLLIVVVALAGCGEPPAPTTAARKASRQEKADIALSTTPVPRVYQDHGAYFYVHKATGRWEHLGTDKEAATAK